MPLMHRWLLPAALWIALVLSAAVLASERSENLASPFYHYTAQDLAGPPGSLIRAEPMAGAPLGANAYRVLYRSRGVHDEPIAVSGVVVVPAGAAPPGGRPIVAWAHPTTGVASICAPSVAGYVFQRIIGLHDMVRDGYIVAATDYPGLGTAGPHPYLVAGSEARSVIDSVRAARQLPGADAGNAYAVWGHSQGGQAALATGALSASYAPELRLVGVAAAAPATDLLKLLSDDANTDGGRNVTAMTLWSWQQVYHVPLTDIVAPSAMPAVDALSNECIESWSDILARSRSQRPLRQEFLTVPNLSQVEPWKTLLAADATGTPPVGMPLLITQGSADGLVLPAVTRAYVQARCKAGERVQYVELPGVHHGMAAIDSAAVAVPWMADRFAGVAAPTSCPLRGT